MSNTFTSVQHPSDIKYQMERRLQINECLKMTPKDLDLRLRYLASDTSIRDDHNLSSKIIGEMRTQETTPRAMKGILDSTGGSGGPLVRQDLEPILYSMFVQDFPLFDRLAKGPSNGLVHAATQITSPDSGSAGSTLVAETGTVNYSTGAYNRATWPIGVFATGRGVTIKERAAVLQGGAPNHDPSMHEMTNGMLKLSSDIQYFMLQGNASNSSGAGAATEKGPYDVNSIDGFRGVLGSQGTFSSNSATQVDINSLNITESLRFGATQGANKGGRPTLALMTLNSKQALDDEHLNNVRYNDNLQDLIPGTRVTSITYSNGQLLIVPLPGTTMGTYTRTSDSATVEDIYFIDERNTFIRWLYSENFTILEIPTGSDAVLSERWIIFGMYGLEVATPNFMGKVRRLAS